MTKKATFALAKEILNYARVAESQGKLKLPPLVFLGVGQEQTSPEVTELEIRQYLFEVFKDEAKARYVCTSYITGNKLITALDSLIKAFKVHQNQDEKVKA